MSKKPKPYQTPRRYVRRELNMRINVFIKKREKYRRSWDNYSKSVFKSIKPVSIINKEEYWRRTISHEVTEKHQPIYSHWSRSDLEESILDGCKESQKTTQKNHPGHTHIWKGHRLLKVISIHLLTDFWTVNTQMRAPISPLRRRENGQEDKSFLYTFYFSYKLNFYIPI